MFGFWIRQTYIEFVYVIIFVEYALHDKCIQEQKCRRLIVQQPETKSDLNFVDKSLIKTASLTQINFILKVPLGLYWRLLIRASGKTFRRRVFDTLESAIDACLLITMFCRRPVLPGPASPPRCTPQPDPTVVFLVFRIDNF